jgi:FKBP-type peptidyl-prolyl cis-trans isomerase FklB
MRFTTLMAVALLAGPFALASAEEPLSLDSENARINYSLGHQIGADFKRQGIELSTPAMMKGVEDALSGAEPMMKPDEMRSTLMGLRQKLIAEKKRQADEEARTKIEEGKRFLEENAKQPGVKTTESGLQYQIVEEGTGSNPGPTDKVTVNYRGTLVDGTEFDSSYKRGEPTSFPLNNVVKGWTEGLQLIKEGGKIKLFVPSDLAYGSRGRLANQTLIFDVELISVGEPKPAPEPAAAEPKAE